MKLYYWTDKDKSMVSGTCVLFDGEDGGNFEYSARLQCNRRLVKFYLAEWIFDKIDESFVDSFSRMARAHGFERKELEIEKS